MLEGLSRQHRGWFGFVAINALLLIQGCAPARATAGLRSLNDEEVIARVATDRIIVGPTESSVLFISSPSIDEVERRGLRMVPRLIDRMEAAQNYDELARYYAATNQTLRRHDPDLWLRWGGLVTTVKSGPEGDVVVPAGYDMSEFPIFRAAVVEEARSLNARARTR